MPKPLSRTTTAEVKAMMSIAGEPDKAIELIGEILTLIKNRVDIKNIPSIDNAQLAMERVVAELKLWQKMEQQRQHL